MVSVSSMRDIFLLNIYIVLLFLAYLYNIIWKAVLTICGMCNVKTVFNRVLFYFCYTVPEFLVGMRLGMSACPDMDIIRETIRSLVRGYRAQTSASKAETAQGRTSCIHCADTNG
ncbi:hypothetical protein BJ165DRAFT_1457409, partial [Panaeolus papilionaceus]